MALFVLEKGIGKGGIWDIMTAESIKTQPVISRGLIISCKNKKPLIAPKAASKDKISEATVGVVWS